jgi:hypothetical protein
MKNTILFILLLIPFVTHAQQAEKVIFDAADSTGGYYLAFPPHNDIKGVVVFFKGFSGPENILPDTKLQNVAYANGLLFVFASMKSMIFATKPANERMTGIIRNVVEKYKVDTSRIALGGFDYEGNAVLRYVELTQQHPDDYPYHPKAVFTVASPVDLFALQHWCWRQMRKSAGPGEGRYIWAQLDWVKNSYKLDDLTPFHAEDTVKGNEQYLRNVAVRLYYDLDITWQLKARANSLYDTDIPEATELISRLLTVGNTKAELVSGLQGRRSDGVRNPNSMNIVDEIECIAWLKKSLDVFDPVTWEAPYKYTAPEGWATERMAFPVEFAPEIQHKGMEDLRFMPGWGNAQSEEYWCYTFLWWLADKPEISAASIKADLEKYYDGLVKRNIRERQIPADKVVSTAVSVKKVNEDTYNATINMLDYMQQQPITLNAVIHKRTCKGKVAMFIEISPKPYAHKVWSALDKVTNSFDCGQ